MLVSDRMKALLTVFFHSFSKNFLLLLLLLLLLPPRG
jgi:hypothetical protein